jgi:2-polyprenyl-6-hydroxyphenyl methylase/3-demethylubiquinone-9 3-methyltransferase
LPADERFAFGQNWQSFAGLVDEERIAGAEQRLATLLGTPRLGGQSFLDIGCGSGLHALAALRLGAERVVALDIDPLCAATARQLLERFWGKANATVINASVFELERRPLGEFDVVYSWGVLHHTGDMARAIAIAARHVRRGGLLALALYGKTPWCAMWKRIKRWYVSAPPERQAWAERVYVRLFGLYLLARGKRLRAHIEQYAREKRGMDFYHDVRDWVGGYPYESIAPAELQRMLEDFTLVREKTRRRSGLFGSGNDEYVFRKR